MWAKKVITTAAALWEVPREQQDDKIIDMTYSFIPFSKH